MEKNNKEKQDRIEIIKNVCIVLLSVIIVVNLIIGIKSISSGGKMGFYTLRFFIMSNDSSETETNSGDLIVANKTMVKNLKQNDIIIYRKNNSYVIKVIEKIEKDNNDINIYVRKNINNNDDSEYEKVEKKDVMGKELFKIRGVGNIAIFIKSPLGAFNLLLILLCAYIIIKKIVEKNIESEKNDEGK